MVKTIKVGSRTQTMKVSGRDEETLSYIPSEEEIGKLTGA